MPTLMPVMAPALAKAAPNARSPPDSYNRTPSPYCRPLAMPPAGSITLPPIRPGSWEAWRVALRPKTLWIATIPVIVATCLAWSLEGVFDLWIAFIALNRR